MKITILKIASLALILLPLNRLSAQERQTTPTAAKQDLAKKIAAQAPLAVQACLEAVHQGADLPLAKALALEAHLFGQLSATEDKKEGTAAFLAKRPPTWTGH